jgi:signal transduction histidine kinase
VKRRRTISSQLTIWFSSVLFVSLTLFGVTMWFDLGHTLVAGRTRTLERRADRLDELLRSTEVEPAAARASKFLAFADATGGGLIQVLHRDGTFALPSPSAAGSFPWPRLTGERDRIQEVALSDQPYLVLTRSSPNFILRMAAPLEGNRTILRAFSQGLTWTIPALLIVSALGGYMLSRRALKPVDQITAAARSITVSNLAERLPVPQTADELQRLSETHNAMLERLETAVNELKRFTSDASHELRSPLSFIRTVAEVAARNAKTEPASRRAFEEIVEECGKAGRLLEDMLTLARADAGSAQFAFEPVDLTQLVSAVCDKARVVAAARDHTLTFSSHGTRPATVWADYASVRRLIWILLDNAIKYTPPPGLIQVTVEAGEQGVLVTVRDNGIGVSSSDLPHIFGRFYRADPSRSDVQGAGLGLSIAQWIANAHQARVHVESEENMGSVFQVAFSFMETDLPLAAAAACSSVRR